MSNPFDRLEAMCANTVERAFAIAFPSALEPVQIARKLVAAFEAGSATVGRAGRRFSVRLHPSDYARFEAELPYLERQWTAMLARLAERSGRPQSPPAVVAKADATVASGMVVVASVARPQPERLVLRVRKGVPPGARIALEGDVVIGRDPGCTLVLADPRASRRHVQIVVADALRFRDLASSNGTLLNGRRVDAGRLGCGDVLTLGDSEVVVEADAGGTG